jgi:hypothetical protein
MISEHASMGSAILGTTTIRLFVSSTFSDFTAERTLLQQEIFPALRDLCRQDGFRFQPIDLRWGVSEAAGTERETLAICFDELERCRALSPDCFLLIQLGDRYGSYILPPVIAAGVVLRLLPYCSPEERTAFDAAYRLDENAVPPHYVLLRAEGPEQAEDEAVRQVLVRAGRAAGLAEEERLPFEASATHREIQLGLLGTPLDTAADRGVLCAVRTFSGQLQGAETGRFVEHDAARAAQVRQLTAAVLDRLPSAQVLHYAVEWPDEQGSAFDADALAEQYRSLLLPKLEAVIAARTAARMVAAAQGHDATELANAAFAAQRAARVEGRETELARLAAYLADAQGAGLPLVVTGPAGSGKSTLLAEAAKRAAVAQPGAALVVRYLGVTPGTNTLVELLENLRGAMAQAYGEPESFATLDE